MIRGFFLKRSRSYKIMQNVTFHVKLLSPTLTTSLFIDLIFFLLNLAFVLWVALAILFSNTSILGFKLFISFDKFLNFLFNLEFLFLLRFSCLLVKGCRTSNFGCWVGSSCRLSGEKLLAQLFSTENNLLI